MQERFMVRTVIFVGDSYTYQNTMADSRPMAVKQAERIGPLEGRDRENIRLFLEGMDFSDKIFKCLDVFSGLVQTGHVNVATIYKID